MLFNTLNFALFLPIVFMLYWSIKSKHIKWQNGLLLVASYFFYSCWDWRFLFLLLFSTLLDYYTGIKISDTKNSKTKKIWLWISIGINLGFLGVFKYYNFFAESFAEAISQMGFQVNTYTLQIILPVGISFYTFHGLSYVIDIYYKRISAEKDFVDYSLFVSFFPLLVAGPIERATHLLPQLKKERNFNYAEAVIGLKQILWGLFKKVVIADQCAEYANMIFNNADSYYGSTLLLGAVFFAFQIYGDFSGYSDIALGTAKLFGINLLKNFSFPYFSRDIAEFWRRWHISLSSWFKDYLYIPLGGSQGGLWKKIRNTFIIFLVSGFWHGASWTFIAWGAINALYFLPLLISNKNRTNIDVVAQHTILPNPKEFMQMSITFLLTTMAWIFFRVDSLTEAFQYINNICSPTLFSLPQQRPSILITLISIFIVIEWVGRRNDFAIATLFQKQLKPIRWSFYVIICLSIFIFQGKEQQFIYFQF